MWVWLAIHVITIPLMGHDLNMCSVDMLVLLDEMRPKGSCEQLWRVYGVLFGEYYNDLDERNMSRIERPLLKIVFFIESVATMTLLSAFVNADSMSPSINAPTVVSVTVWTFAVSSLSTFSKRTLSCKPLNEMRKRLH